jgi:hypothetical protein
MHVGTLCSKAHDHRGRITHVSNTLSAGPLGVCHQLDGSDWESLVACPCPLPLSLSHTHTHAHTLESISLPVYPSVPARACVCTPADPCHRRWQNPRRVCPRRPPTSRNTLWLHHVSDKPSGHFCLVIDIRETSECVVRCTLKQRRRTDAIPAPCG